jgi:two-component system, OmpR family, response regulator RegX3
MSPVSDASPKSTMPNNAHSSASAIKIAFLEDDQLFAANICRELNARNYVVTHFSTGQSCLSHLVIHDHDVCLFDWNLPDMPGTEVLERLKKIKRMPPVIFMTGNDAENDVAKVLLAGADDYIIKPPVISVLHARIQALLRRTRIHEQPVHKESLGHLVIDYYNKVILRNGKPVSLTGSEAILAFDLFMHRGQIVTRQHLYALLGIDEVAVDTRRLDVHISHLRSKLALNAMNGWKLTSIYQRGYRLEYLYGA